MGIGSATLSAKAMRARVGGASQARVQRKRESVAQAKRAGNGSENQWRKPSVRATEARISGASQARRQTEARIGGARKLIPSIPVTGVRILGGLHDNPSAPTLCQTLRPFDLYLGCRTRPQHCPIIFWPPPSKEVMILPRRHSQSISQGLLRLRCQKPRVGELCQRPALHQTSQQSRVPCKR